MSQPQEAALKLRDREILGRLAPLLWQRGERSNQLRILLALFLLLLAKAVSVGTPFLYKYVVDALVEVDSLIKTGSHIPFLAAPLAFALAYAFARFVSSAFEQLRDILFARIGQQAVRRLALSAFSHIHDLPLSFHLQRRTGSLSRIVDRGVKSIEMLIRFFVLFLTPVAIEIFAVAVIFLVTFDFWFFLALAATVFCYGYFTVKVTDMRVRIRKQMNAADAESNQRAIDSLINYETVKYFDAEAREAARYDNAMANYERMAVQTHQTLAFLNGGQVAIAAVGHMCILALAIWGMVEGRLSLGDLVLVNTYMMFILLPLGFLGTVYREIRQALTDMGELMELLRLSPEAVDQPGCKEPKNFVAELVFDNVSFGYDRHRVILHDFSLHLAKGKMLAVVGPSGSGKSTLARLIYRFYDPLQGSIRLSGLDLHDWPRRQLRQKIGIVPQDIPLFNDSIFYNIAYGCENAALEEVKRVAKAAHIDEFIAALPEGYETQVGERGLRLSGGEKQRIAIARAMLKNPPMLILDEATSALDTRTERGILDSLAALAKNRTVIAVAHRLSTIVDADEILVLEKGRICERGSHQSLLEHDQLYARMWREQEASKQREKEENVEASIA